MDDSIPVKMWRDTFKLNLSVSWKADVDKTIKNLALWEEILSGWYYIKNGKKIRKSPAIKPLLDEYERLSFDGVQSKGSGVHSEKSLPERRDRIVPEPELFSLLSRSRI